MDEMLKFVSIPPHTWTLIFTWANLLILFLIMKKLLFKPITAMLKQREDEVNAMYEKAEEARKNAEALEADYTARLSNAKEEAARIMKDAKEEAALKGEKIVSDAQAQASMALKKAEKEIERDKAAAVKEIKNDIASIAVGVAQKVIEKDLNESDHEKLVEDFINNWGDNK